MIYKLSDVTKEYLDRYIQIINDMQTSMNAVEMKDSISEYYCQTMIPHHEGGIKMSQNILDYTTNIRVEEIAKKIIDSSTSSIKRLEELILECASSINNSRDIDLYLHNHKVIMDRMMRSLEDAEDSNDINRDFIIEMLAHHEGAIKMCRNVLKFDICDGVRMEAEHLIKTQEDEKKELMLILSSLR